MYKNKLFSIIFLIINILCFGQIEYGGTPYSFRKQILQFDDIQTILLPPLDNKLLLENEIIQPKTTGFQFGKEINVNFSLENSGQWENLENGDRLWRLIIKSEGAYSLNLLFDEFFIPTNSYLFIYTSDKKYVTGAFTHENNQPSNTFATALYPSDEIVLEYYESSKDKGLSKLKLSTIVHAYKKLFNKSGTYGSSYSCNININCPSGNNYQDLKRAVVLILKGGSAWCSGTLINNVRQDGHPYVLTANHCILSDMQTRYFVFIFNYESEDCAGMFEKKTYSLNGATVKARHEHSDFCLLELNNMPTREMQPYFAGWDASSSIHSGAVCIHHPSGDLKKISTTNDVLELDKYEDDDDSYPDSTHWALIWNTGTTEGGSSGSALFNLNKRIIGQLDGGTAFCYNLSGTDLFGRTYYSWTNNNNPDSSKRLDFWLDPDNTGTLVLDAFDPYNNDTNINRNNQNYNIKLFPNPAKDIVKIVSDEKQNFNYVIYNSIGQKICSGNIDNQYGYINVNSLSDGMYFVHFFSNNKSCIVKLIVLR